jgi:hypothetical protein
LAAIERAERDRDARMLIVMRGAFAADQGDFEKLLNALTREPTDGK